MLGDEVLTPGLVALLARRPYGRAAPPSFDKQYVRDWLEAHDWDKTSPAPELPRDVAAGAAERYREAYALPRRPTVLLAYLEEQGESNGA